MTIRLLWLLKLIVAVVSLVSDASGQVQSANFTVHCADAKLAQEISEAAELYRDVIAENWLGHKLPKWYKPCAITVRVGQLGAGGSTSFAFDKDQTGEMQVFGWRMNIQGSRERLLDSVLPHEISHTIFACHFRRPLPRWADEGAATLVEHETERARQYLCLRQSAQGGHLYSLRAMLAVKEYPQDMNRTMALYAQGFALTEYLVQQKGEREFLKFIDTANADGWDRAVQVHYGYRGVEELEAEWKGTIDGTRRVSVRFQQRPQLLVFSAPFCLPCMAFKTDWSLDGQFRARLQEQYQVVFIDSSNHKAVADYSVTVFPTFIVPGSNRRVWGYKGKEWLMAHVRSVASDTPHMAQPQALPPPQSIPNTTPFAIAEQPKRDCSGSQGQPVPSVPPAPPSVSQTTINSMIDVRIQQLAASGALKGEPGRDGLDGKDGARGPQGLPGPKGADGEFDATAVLALNAKIAALQAQLNDIKPTNTAPLVAEIVELKERIAHMESQTITLEIQSAGRVVGESESGKLGDAGKRKIRFDVEEITQPNR